MHLSRAALMFPQFLFPLILAQQKAGHFVCACASDDPHLNIIRNQGITAFTHGQKRSLNPLNLIKTIWTTKKLLVENNIDLLICHTPLGGGVGRFAGWLAKTPKIVYFAHGLPFSPSQNILIWLFWFLIEKILGYFTDAIIVMNNYDESFCKKFRFTKKGGLVLRIPSMGVDLQRFTKNNLGVPKESLLKNKCSNHIKIILTIAYLVPEKGVYTLFDAAKIICKERKDVLFLLAGTGPAMNSLEQLCHQYNLHDKFLLLGWRNDIPQLMNISDIFVLPTYYFEGLPVSILEAMACSLPVIATNQRGCVDVVANEQTGYLIPIRDSLSLAAKIITLLNNDDLRINMGQLARQKVESDHELNMCTNIIMQALDQVITNSARWPKPPAAR